MYFLYKNEYRTFKTVESPHKKGTKVERRKIEGMNQFRLYYIYMEMSRWNPCKAILNKQKYLFFKNGEQEGKIGPFWGLVAVGLERI
jgi:hypothetical protein